VHFSPVRLEGICFVLTNDKDNKRFLTGGQDKILRIFDLSKPDADPLKLEGHTQSVKVVVWCKDGNTLISAGGEPELK
jgi:serine-threonine kinase receptor-associated protein